VLKHEQALESIMVAGERNWMAHAWWLERNLPHLYALRTVNRDSANMEQQTLCDKISLEQLVANAKLAAEIAAHPPSGLVQAPELTEGKSDEGWASG
jgi:hypothetical protein